MDVIFVSIISDRHEDLEVLAFRDKDKAVAFTRRAFAAVLAHPERMHENEPESPFILDLSYELEADYAVCVQVSLH